MVYRIFLASFQDKQCQGYDTAYKQMLQWAFNMGSQVFLFCMLKNTKKFDRLLSLHWSGYF